MRDAVEGVEPGFERGQREDRRRAGEKSQRCRRPAGNHRSNANGSAWPIQPCSGERSSSCSRSATYRKAGAPGPAVQIFVAAADREIAAGAVEVELDRAGAVRQVPQRQRAGGVRGGVDRRHVVDGGAAVIDVGQGDDRGVLVDRLDDLVRRGPP